MLPDEINLPDPADADWEHQQSEWDLHLRAVADREIEERAHRTDWKPPKRLTRADVARKYRPGIAWKLAVLERDQGCVYHHNPVYCAEGWHAHHVVTQQELRRTHPEILWHPLSGVGLCGKAHRRHHSGYEPVPYDLLPLTVVDFLGGLGYSGYLIRHYPARAGEEAG